MLISHFLINSKSNQINSNKILLNKLSLQSKSKTISQQQTAYTNRMHYSSTHFLYMFHRFFFRLAHEWAFIAHQTIMCHQLHTHSHIYSVYPPVVIHPFGLVWHAFQFILRTGCEQSTAQQTVHGIDNTPNYMSIVCVV